MATLKQKIMRRVWYSYLLSVLINGATVRGLVLGVSLALFFALVSVNVILGNFLSVPLGSLPQYTWHLLAEALESGKFIELLTLGGIVFSLLSFGFPRFRTPLQAHTMLHV